MHMDMKETHEDLVSLGEALRSGVRGGRLLVSGTLGDAGGVATYVSEELLAISEVECATLFEARVQRVVVTDRESGLRTVLWNMHNFGMTFGEAQRLRRALHGDVLARHRRRSRFSSWAM